MIKTRLLKLLSEGRKYILYQVIWQWIALLGQIVSVFAIGNLAERILEGTVKEPVVLRTLLILLCMTALRLLAHGTGTILLLECLLLPQPAADAAHHDLPGEALHAWQPLFRALLQ